MPAARRPPRSKWNDNAITLDNQTLQLRISECIAEEPNAKPALSHASWIAVHVSSPCTANNREVHLCLKRLLNIIAKHRNITQKLLGTMEKQLNTTRVGITRKRRIMLTLPTVMPRTLAITLTTQARLIRRSTAKSSLPHRHVAKARFAGEGRGVRSSWGAHKKGWSSSPGPLRLSPAVGGAFVFDD